MSKPRHRHLANEDHRRMGLRLTTVRRRLMEDIIRLSATYGKTHASVRYAQTALRNVECMRSELDDILASESTVEQWEQHDLARTYYPGETSANELVESSAD